MGWVTLTLRKKELRATHNEYELRLLSISRQRRQLARQKSLKTTEINAARDSQLAGPKEELYSARNTYNTKLDSLFKEARGGDGKEAQALNQAEISKAQEEYNNAKMKYEEEKDSIERLAEDQMAELEEETTARETELDMEQTSLEAEIEAISQELQAVTQAISSDIQESTIKLA